MAIMLAGMLSVSGMAQPSIHKTALVPRSAPVAGCSLPGLTTRPGTAFTPDDLLAAYNAQAALVRSLEASLMVRARGGKEYKTRSRESKESPAMISFRAPGWLRLTGAVPFTGKRTFDFSSDGREFHLLVPDRNSMRLLVGAVDAPATSTNPRDNLRPQPLIGAFRWNPGTLEQASMPPRSGFDTPLNVRYSSASPQKDAIRAVVEFDLRRGVVDRIEVQDESKQTITQVDYSDWMDWASGANQSQKFCFPRRISLTQPKQNLALEIKVIGLTLNPEIPLTKFRLHVPAGTQVARINEHGPTVP